MLPPALGVNTLTVCHWENNLTNPRLYLLPKIFDFLGHYPSQCNAITLAGWETGRSGQNGKLVNRLQEILDHSLVL